MNLSWLELASKLLQDSDRNRCDFPLKFQNRVFWEKLGKQFSQFSQCFSQLFPTFPSFPSVFPTFPSFSQFFPTFPSFSQFFPIFSRTILEYSDIFLCFLADSSMYVLFWYSHLHKIHPYVHTVTVMYINVLLWLPCDLLQMCFNFPISGKMKLEKIGKTLGKLGKVGKSWEKHWENWETRFPNFSQKTRFWNFKGKSHLFRSESCQKLK